MSSDWDDGSDDLTTTGFIVCKACGTRVRASREACLRCGEPLEAAAPTVTLDTIKSGRPLVVTIAIGLTVLGFVFLVWFYRPLSDEDAARAGTGAAPGVAAPRQPARGGVQASAQAVPPAPAEPEPSEFLDAPRTSPVDQLAAGDLAAARAQLERSLEQNPNDVEGLNNLGRVLVRLGNLPGAATRFEHASVLAPDNWAYHFNFAHVFSDEQQWDRAAAEYHLAANILPSDSTTAFNLALALQKLGNNAAAIPQFRLAIGLAPGEARFHRALGASLEKAGDADAARQEYQTYLNMATAAADAPAIQARIAALAARGGGGTP